MDIMNGSYAQTHFPCKLWDAGEKGLTLSAFEWEKDRKDGNDVADTKFV